MNIKINDNILSVNKIIESIENRTDLHEKLIETKNISISLNKDIDNKRSQFDKKEKDISKLLEEMETFDSFKKEENESITYINNLILEMRKDNSYKIQDFRPNINMNNLKLENEKYKSNNENQNFLTNFIESNTKSINLLMAYSYVILKENTEIYNQVQMENVEISTSLDLLFIMDITQVQ